mgnify:FL=1|tara:strand:+ start:1379 stop:1981 length:603 start_codon:yes stop_codon:yes gene_type:complete
MKEENIISLFPTPIQTSYLKPLSSKQLNKIKKIRKLEENSKDKNSYVLEEKIFKDLKKQINQKINNYVETILQPKKGLDFYITQSWFTWTGKNQYHYTHSHPNSIISGVYYVEADPTVDKILFTKTIPDQIKIYPETFNIFNSDTWWLSVKTNSLIIFPSSLFHKVGDVPETYNKRISLPFNVFAKGELGSNTTLTKLIL